MCDLKNKFAVQIFCPPPPPSQNRSYGLGPNGHQKNYSIGCKISLHKIIGSSQEQIHIIMGAFKADSHLCLNDVITVTIIWIRMEESFPTIMD